LFGPSTTITITITNAASLLDVAQIGVGQAVIRHGVFACVLQAMLRDGSAHLLALARIWPTLRMAFDRQQHKHNCDCDSAHFLPLEKLS
jgi:hypothetical protein